MSESLRIFLKEGHACFRVRVQPRASRTGLAGLWGDALRVRVSAPPQRSRANRALVEFLAGLLGVPRGAVRVAAGSQSRTKTISIEGLNEARIRSILTPYLAGADNENTI